MTAPTLSGPLPRTLALVDVSRARTQVLEDAYVAEIDAVYAAALASWKSSPRPEPSDGSDDGSALLTAALLAALVAILRRAHAAGVAEGVAFARQQVESVGGTPPLPVPPESFLDLLVADFIRGQAESSVATGLVSSRAQVLQLADGLRSRARLAAVVAVHAGRSAAVLASIEQAADDVGVRTGSRVHKMWVARFDQDTPPCKLCVRLHGTHVPLDADFPVLSKEPPPYGGVLNVPPRHPRCRCSVVLFLPDVAEPKVTPRAMTAYADNVLATHLLDGHEYVAATVVHVKPYTRVIDGKTQQVSGYYYDVQTGLKVAGPSGAPAPEVSQKQAKAITTKAKSTSGAAKPDFSKSKFGPGTYAVSLPDGSQTQVLVHKDGSSTSVNGPQTEDSDPTSTEKFLSYWDGLGAVTQVSGDPDEAENPDVSTPLEPSAKDKQAGSVPPGHYLLPDSDSFGGFVVNADGKGFIYSKNFEKKLPLKAKSVKDIAAGNLGEFVAAEEKELVSDFQKELGEANKATKDPTTPAPVFPEYPGDAVLSHLALFQVGSHMVQFDAGSQVFSQKAGSDTIYVLDPQGQVTKYNPQGKGVQATLVAGPDNPGARANLLAGLQNTTTSGVPTTNNTPAPGTNTTTIGGVSVTSQQLESAISDLVNSPSSKVGPVLQKTGNPLATTDYHAIAAPHKAHHNNKTKPAFLAALTAALVKTGVTPPPEAQGKIAHMLTQHGLPETPALATPDVDVVHAALHVVAIEDHDHAGAGPGLIDLAGTPATPEQVQQAITLLEAEPSTSVKGPLKKAGSPLAGADLAGLANDAAGTKVHYGKLKPAVVKVLQDVLNQHQQAAPPTPALVLAPLPEKVLFHGVSGTLDQLTELKAALADIEIDKLSSQHHIKAKLSNLKDNPFTALDFAAIADEELDGKEAKLYQFNELLDSALSKKLTEHGYISPDVGTAKPDTQAPYSPGMQVDVGGTMFTKGELDAAVAALQAEPSTSVKKPIKAISPALGGLDLKTLAEQHAGTSIHYGKLKAAVIDFLSAKAGGSASGAEQPSPALPDAPAIPAVPDAGDGLTLEDGTYIQAGAYELKPGESYAGLKSGITLKVKDGKAHYANAEMTRNGDEGVYVSDSPVLNTLFGKSSPFQLVGATPAASVVTKAGGGISLEDGTHVPEGDYELKPGESYAGMKSGITLKVKDGKAHYADSDGDDGVYGSETPFVLYSLFGDPSPFQLVGSTPKSEPSVLDQDPLTPTPVPGDKVGVYAAADGTSIIVLPDGSGTVNGLVIPIIQVNNLIDSGMWTKLSDSPEPGVKPDPTPPEPTPQAVVLSLPTTIAPSSQDKAQLITQVEKWVSEAGYSGVAGLHLSGQKKEVVLQWMSHWYNGDWDKAYALESQNIKKHKGEKTHPGSPLYPANVNGFTKKQMAPAVAGELPAGTIPPGVWPEVGTKNAYSALSHWTDDQIDAYLLAANMQNPTGMNAFNKKKWVTNHYLGYKMIVDITSNTAKAAVAAGYFGSDPIVPNVEKYDPGFAVPHKSDWADFDPTKSHAKNLTSSQLNYYLAHVGSKSVAPILMKQPEDVRQQIVQLHYVASLPLNTPAFKTPATAKLELLRLMRKIEQRSKSAPGEELTQKLRSILHVEKHTYSKDKDQPSLNGHTEIIHVTDETGQPHLFKVAGEPFRADQEHATHELAALVGHTVAGSQLGEFEGKFGQFQVKLDSQSTLQGVDPAQLSLSSLKDVVNSHVFDWLVSNDDAAGRNFLLSPTGSRVYPIDLGRAFAAFGKPGQMQLKRGSTSALESTYYDKIYATAVSGGLSQSDVDSLYFSTISTARRMQVSDRERFAEIMRSGMERRTNYSMTSASDRESLIAQVLDRKDSLVTDFESFWDDLYAEMGRAKPEKQRQHVFSGVSQAYLDRAQAVGAAGASTFFAGTALEDGHLLAQVVHKVDPDAPPDPGASDDPAELWLSGQLRKDADASFREWLKAHSTNTISSGAGTLPSTGDAVLASLGLNSASETINTAAKTISHHHKQGNINYNTAVMQKLDTIVSSLKAHRSTLDFGGFPKSLADSHGIVSEEDKQQYAKLISFYEGQINKLEDLKTHEGMSSIGDYPSFEWVPSNAGDLSLEVPSDISVRQVTTSYEINRQGSGGDLVSTGQSDDKSHSGQAGIMYLVTLPDKTEIEYRSWHHQEDIRTGQQGQIKIKVRNHDGGTSGAEAAMAALREMGLGLTDSDDTDLELLYWRSLYGSLQDRKDVNSEKYTRVSDKAKELGLGEGPGGTSIGADGISLARELEIEHWRTAWREADPVAVNAFVAEKRYLPRFSHPNTQRPDMVGGRPHWQRFDVSEGWGKTAEFPVASLASDGDLLRIIRSGGYYSTEDRVSVTGGWRGGASSTSDQERGSSNFAFMRQGGSDLGYYSVFFSPDVLTRTSNYQFEHDLYGDPKLRPDHSYFDFEKSTGYTVDHHSSNETMVKHGMSLLDDIEMLSFTKPEEREEALDYLRKSGVTEIRGVLIEDRLVTTKDAKSALAKLRESRRARSNG